MEKWWVQLRRDGTVKNQEPNDAMPRGRGWIEVDRKGDLAVETVKRGVGWVPRRAEDVHGAIDRAHEADNPGSRSFAYVIKEIEARIILGTLATDGLVAREAATRGVAVADLAAAIVAKADEDQRELSRIARKLAASREAPKE